MDLMDMQNKWVLHVVNSWGGELPGALERLQHLGGTVAPAQELTLVDVHDWQQLATLTCAIFQQIHKLDSLRMQFNHVQSIPILRIHSCSSSCIHLSTVRIPMLLHPNS